MSKANYIGVLGGGSWGTTIAHLVRGNGHPTLLWMRDKKVAADISKKRCNTRYLPEFELEKGIKTCSNLDKVARECRLIFVAVPTAAMRDVVRALSAHLLPDHLLISCSKGLEAGTAKRMTEILREESCCLRVGALSGPNLAAEVLKGDPSATVIASRYDELVVAATRVLMGPRFRVYGNSDVLGAELGGALKNVIAIAAGVAAGLGFGDNTKSLLVTRGLAEIRRLGVRMGADPMTFAGMAGIGDLMVTCASPLSRNHQVGRRLAAGQRLDQIRDEMMQVAEGVNTTRVAVELSEKLDVFMPIARGIFQLIYDERPALEVVKDLMAVQATYEVDTPIIL
jgi:glycerol-3-phosphate dehydrogenase (NAD(P)+)